MTKWYFVQKMTKTLSLLLKNNAKLFQTKLAKDHVLLQTKAAQKHNFKGV